MQFISEKNPDSEPDYYLPGEHLVFFLDFFEAFLLGNSSFALSLLALFGKI